MTYYSGFVPNPTAGSIGQLVSASGTIPGAVYPPRAGGTSIVAASIPWYNVKDYGAACDGVTDDTAAVNAAITAAPAAGAVITGPAGVTVLFNAAATQLTLNSNLIFDGQGRTITWKIGSSFGAAALFSITGTQNNITFRNMVFDLNGTTKALINGSTLSTHIGTATTSGLTFIGNQVINSGVASTTTFNFLRAGSSNNWLVADNLFNCAGILVNPSNLNQSIIRDNVCLAPTSFSANNQLEVTGNIFLWTGFTVTSILNVLVLGTAVVDGNYFSVTGNIQNVVSAGVNSAVTNNTLAGCQSSFAGTTVLLSAGVGVVSNNTVVNCTTNGATTGQSITAISAGNQADGNNITSLTTAPAPGGSTYVAIGITFSGGGSAVGNWIQTLTGSFNGGATVTAQGIVNAVVASGNYVASCFGGIYGDNQSNIAFTGNNVQSYSDTGIRAVSAGGDVLIADNLVFTGTNEAIYVSTSTAAKVVIDGNQIDAITCTAAGMIYVTGGNDVKVANNHILNPAAGCSVPMIALVGAVRGRIVDNYLFASALPTGGGTGTTAMSIDATSSQIFYDGNQFVVGGVTDWTTTDSGTNDKSGGANYKNHGATWTAF